MCFPNLSHTNAWCIGSHDIFDTLSVTHVFLDYSSKQKGNLFTKIYRFIIRVVLRQEPIQNTFNQTDKCKMSKIIYIRLNSSVSNRHVVLQFSYAFLHSFALPCMCLKPSQQIGQTSIADGISHIWCRTVILRLVFPSSPKVDTL